MSWFLFILAALSTLMLWRDLRSGRIYYTDKHAGLDYDDPEPFYEKSSSPTLYRVVIVTVAVCCLIASGLGILFFFIPEEYLFDSKPLLILFTIAFIVLILYLIYGAVGRATSWIKNYGSIDKKW